MNSKDKDLEQVRTKNDQSPEGLLREHPILSNIEKKTLVYLVQYLMKIVTL